MTQLNDILDIDALEQEIAGGYINRRHHPEFPELAIVGYSDKAQFDSHWTPAVRAARGIIYNTVTMTVLARPFPKFFNYGQEPGVQYDLDAPILGAFNKWDGSLGIGYMRPDGKFAIATRGSFDSEQARHANAWLARPRGSYNPALVDLRESIQRGETPLYEIIYPENRIVLNYGDMDELVKLGSIDIEDGSYWPQESGVERSHANTLRQVLELPDRKNAEGWVVWLDDRTAVKLKQADYQALHRIVSSLTTKEVWRQLRDGTFEEFATALPDEFHEWAKREAANLAAEHELIVSDARYVHANVVAREFPDRKAQALYIQRVAPAELRGLVFSLLDGRDIADKVWRMVEPSGTGEREGVAA